MDMRNIEIDFEIHKRIELERSSFSETPNAVLRRILGLSSSTPQPTLSQPGGRAWSGNGVTLPHGTKLKMEYNGRVHHGEIADGHWLVENQHFNSPSAAAGGVGITRAGRHTKLDGWKYWNAKRPNDNGWHALSTLRG